MIYAYIFRRLQVLCKRVKSVANVVHVCDSDTSNVNVNSAVQIEYDEFKFREKWISSIVGAYRTERILMISSIGGAYRIERILMISGIGGTYKIECTLSNTYELIETVVQC